MNRASIARILAPLAALALAVLPVAASAQAPDPRGPVQLSLAGPADVPLGNQARLVVRLRTATGAPVAGARVVVTSPAAFAGAVGEMALGEAVTDAEGAATLDYELRIAGRNQFVARYYGDERNQPTEARTVVAATGEAQLAQRSAGVPFPVPVSSVLIAVLAMVWMVYFLAMLRVVGIPEAPTDAEAGGVR